MSTATGGHTGRAIYTGLTATGTNQATALPLAGRGDSVQEVTTVAASTGVLLPPIILPMRVEIVNQGVSSLSVYPRSGGTIDNGSVNASTALSAGKSITLEASSLTNWYTVAVSTGGGAGAGTVTSVTGGAGLAGGTITSTGTLSLAPIADQELLANTSGSSAVPVATTLTALIDEALGNTQGDVLYRDSAAWKVLAPGTAGNVLTTHGASANPTWGSGSSYSPNVQVFTSSGSYTIPSGATFIRIVGVQAGGGGGGGACEASGTVSGGGAGGGGGAGFDFVFRAADLSSPVTVTIGAAGTGGAGGATSGGNGVAGNGGGVISFGTYFVGRAASGGGPGSTSAGVSAAGGIGQAGGGAGGTGGTVAAGSGGGAIGSGCTPAAGSGGGGGGGVSSVPAASAGGAGGNLTNATTISGGAGGAATGAAGSPGVASCSITDSATGGSGGGGGGASTTAVGGVGGAGGSYGGGGGGGGAGLTSNGGGAGGAGGTGILLAFAW